MINCRSKDTNYVTVKPISDAKDTFDLPRPHGRFKKLCNPVCDLLDWRNAKP